MARSSRKRKHSQEASSPSSSSANHNNNNNNNSNNNEDTNTDTTTNTTNARFNWQPARIQSAPRFYIQALPNSHKKEVPFASAALLGLSRAKLVLLCPLSLSSTSSSSPFAQQQQQQSKKPSKEDIIKAIAKWCPNVLELDYQSVFRKLLNVADVDIIHLLLVGPKPLISAVKWDRDLAVLAVQKAPLCYLHVPSSLLTNNNEYKLRMESHFRKLLVSGDATTVDFLLHESSSHMERIVWDAGLALEAVTKTPQFYQHVPTSLKTNNTPLALAALCSPNVSDIDKMTMQVHSHCRGLFANTTTMALHEVIRRGGESLIAAVLRTFCGDIVWTTDLVEKARVGYPATYSFLPACFRDDHVDAQRVMASLLLSVHDDDDHDDDVAATAVDEMAAAVPGFFLDRDAVMQLFRAARSDGVVCHVVKSMSRKLPWNRELAFLAAKRCQKSNLLIEEIARLWVREVDCKYHVPLGMLLSCHVQKAIRAMDDHMWPDFLNGCRCALLSCNDSALLESLQFVENMVPKIRLTTVMITWLQGLIHRVRMEFQDMAAFHTLLLCISVHPAGGSLECLKGDDETSIALKRRVAEYLGARTNRTSVKLDAMKLVFCLMTLPDEFKACRIVPSSMIDYQSAGPLGSPYCNWCCHTLATLEPKYFDTKEDGADDIAGVDDLNDQRR